jgi:hypothetical protein
MQICSRPCEQMPVAAASVAVLLLVQGVLLQIQRFH